MQPAPKPNNTQPIHEQVIEDIKRRAEVGKQNYGTYLQVGNGRDSLLDAYEEAQDKALYLKQAILERDDLVMELEAAREAVSEESNRWVSVIRGIDPEAPCDFHSEMEAAEWAAKMLAEARRDGARARWYFDRKNASKVVEIELRCIQADDWWDYERWAREIDAAMEAK